MLRPFLLALFTRIVQRYPYEVLTDKGLLQCSNARGPEEDSLNGTALHGPMV
jgi:hypothetical protein